MTSPPATCVITIGVDSYKDAHVAAAVDQLGRILATNSIPTTSQGFVQLQRWATRLGQVDRFGIEGTGSFAAGLTRWSAGALRGRSLLTTPAYARAGGR